MLETTDAPPDQTTLRPLLREGATIAFLPPGFCRELSAVPGSATESQTVLRNECGIAMTELEREAARSGFKVVSWQALRPGITGTALELARALKVDGIIEVDELTFNQLDPASRVNIEVRFFNGDITQGGDRRLIVPDALKTADACRAIAPELATGTPFASATASVKLVGVEDATVRWLFRKTLSSSRALRRASMTAPFRGDGGWAARRGEQVQP